MSDFDKAKAKDLVEPTRILKPVDRPWLIETRMFNMGVSVNRKT